jgi:hypothetical protein
MGPLFECTVTVTVTVQTEMAMSLSVLRVDRFTSPIPIPQRRSFVTNGESRVCQRSESFISPLLITPVPPPPSSLEEPGHRRRGEALKDEERGAEDL